MDSWLVFAVAGVAAGLLSGLFGVGGGLILVPVLTFVLPHMGLPPDAVVQTAIGTSLAVIACHSIASAHAHHRRGGVLWAVVGRMAPGLAVGSFAGAYVAHLLPGSELKKIVAIGAALIAIQMALDLKPRQHRPLPGAAGQALAGVVIGTASALVGIGGGSLTVPFLSWRSVEIKQAVGTSAACGIVIAAAGALGFALTGLGVTHAPHMLGYVHVPGFLMLMIASVSSSGFGAKLAHRLPARTLKRAFALFLCGVAIALWMVE
jgi:uncharacterized protein